ncbi:polysaccharide lyase family 8 super-sandwich domain-containing protein [Microlunatus sp. Y2014]|uniref:polysaccharide lyase family 8 super-sandwich domain-containing protein n=1 Tax=Microlunatus sp. Y2014 TaxID=3418488 RepID=UPI003DA751C1
MRCIETIVENRNLHAEGSNRLLVDGDEQIPGLDTSRTLHSPRWAHLEGVGGYLFEPGTVLKMRRETRSGAWSTINGTGPTEVLQRRFLTVWIWHGTNPYGHSYGYVLLPGATAEQTAAAATSGGHEVLVNDELTQAARIGDVRGFAFWQANSVDGVTTDGPGTVLIKDADGIRTVAVTPHGVGGDALIVELPSGVWSTLADDGEATVATRGDTISITVPRSSTPREFTVVFHL